MVDRASRDELARVVRRLVAGLITSDELAREQCDTLRDSRDLGVQAIRLAAAQLGEDLREEGLPGGLALGKAGRRAVAHWILFLKSELEYEWPDLTVWRAFVLALPDLLRVGAAGRVLRTWDDGPGDADAWRSRKK
jgi:hypothetical protein